MVTRSVGPAFLVASLSLALAATGCSVFRGSPPAEPVATASTNQNAGQDPEQIDVRRLIGPDYCPELRILDGAELVRRYEPGHEGDDNAVLWQASFSQTARDCLYDTQGGLAIKVGVSGRVIAGPKGGSGDVTVPFKIAVVKFKEATLASEGYTLAATIPPTGSTTFAEVREIKVPSPGRGRDYIIYVGFDSGEWDLDAGAVAVAPVETPPPVVEEEPFLLEEEEPLVAAPAQPAEPNVLPTPTGGFVLPR
jgi:hypothetical protein